MNEQIYQRIFQWIEQFYWVYLESVTYKTIEFVYTYFAGLDFFTLLFLFHYNVRSAEKEYIHNYDTENE